MGEALQSPGERNRYWACAHNAEGCLRNGSFVRRSRYGLGQFTNGDFVGFIDAVPEGMVEVDGGVASCLIPGCCH